MRYAQLLTLFPLTGLANALPSKIAGVGADAPDLDVKQWHAVQGGLFDSVWAGLAEWSLDWASTVVQDVPAVQGLGDKDKTVWEQLKSDDHFTKLVKAIEFAGYEDKFDTTEAKFTLFAPNNDALKKPEHQHVHHSRSGDEILEALHADPDLATALDLIDHPAFSFSTDSDDKDEDKKKRIKFFRFLVRRILEYHVLPTDLPAAKLLHNSTVETLLKSYDKTYAGLNRRIKVQKSLIPPAVILNFYVRVIEPDKEASNGLIHVVDKPLVPLPSLFDSTFILPDLFSTYDSAIQAIGGRKYIDFQYEVNISHPEDYKTHGNPLATLFVPTNFAFEKLPKSLRFFLFSPFGKRALEKILRYHAIPKTLLLSELLVDLRKDGHKLEYFSGGEDGIAYHREFDIATALPDATLHVVIDKKKILNEFYVVSIAANGLPAIETDVQAINGAFHVSRVDQPESRTGQLTVQPIRHVLIPPHKHHDEKGASIAHLDTWDNWHEWLPAFAAKD